MDTTRNSTRNFENNKVTLVGEIETEPQFSHEVFGEKFYIFNLAVTRLSDFLDHIPVMISEKFVDVDESYIGKKVEVQGWFRSYNMHNEGRNKLFLSATVRDVVFLENIEEVECKNNIILDGYICKQPIYRKTPLGREITDVLIAVNRSYGKSDYIPCICWGRNARYTAGFEVGTHVQLFGRIQSREYVKKLSETEREKRIAHEVSVSKIIIE